jgi:hypothetical protein
LVDRIDVPVLLPFVVEDFLSTSELVSFHPLDSQGEPKAESVQRIQLQPVGGFVASFWSGGNFYLPPAKIPGSKPTPERQSP